MELVIRALVAFLLLWLITRVVGRRALGQLSAFELLLLLVIGDLIQQGVTQEDYSLTGGALVISVFSLLAIAVSYLSWKFPSIRPTIDGKPIIIVRNGELVEEAMHSERLPVDELFEALRREGIRSLDEVDTGVLEANGSYSFLRTSS